MNVLDLFSGIGGFSLGLERAGMRTVAFCEIDPYCRRVLAKHWPTVPVWGDIRTLTGQIIADAIGSQLREQSGRRHGASGADPAQPGCNGSQGIDLICGGFPCQDISVAGKGAGIGGARSGLWSEYARIIGEVRPRYVIVENVAALLGRGLDVVLGDLAALGYDAEWHCIRAADVGAPHLRDRVWIIAHPQHSDADCERPHRADEHKHRGTELRDEQERELGSLGEALADTDQPRLEGWLRKSLRECSSEWTTRQSSPPVADSIGQRKLQSQGLERESWRRPSDRRWWRTEPDVGRVAHGVPARVDRLRSLGNAVVPQIPEIIGRAIMSSMRQ